MREFRMNRNKPIKSANETVAIANYNVGKKKGEDKPSEQAPYVVTEIPFEKLPMDVYNKFDVSIGIKNDEVAEVITELPEEEESLSDFEKFQLVKKCLSKGIITRKGGFYYLNYKDADSPPSIKGKNSLLETIDDEEVKILRGVLNEAEATEETPTEDIGEMVEEAEKEE